MSRFKIRCTKRKINETLKWWGVAGVTGLDSKTGRVPDAQLPAYVSGVEVQFSNGTVQFNIAKSK